MKRTRQELEAINRQLAQALSEELPPGDPIGWALLIFDFGPNGFMTYCSNSERADMIRALREQADRLEVGTANTKGEA